MTAQNKHLRSLLAARHSHMTKFWAMRYKWNCLMEAYETLPQGGNWDLPGSLSLLVFCCHVGP